MRGRWVFYIEKGHYLYMPKNFLEVCVCHRILASSWHYFGTEMWQQS